MDDPQAAPDAPTPEPVPAGLLDRLADGDERTLKRLAVLCLAASVLLAAGGGFAWGHLGISLGCWLGAAGLMLTAWLFGWEPSEKPDATYAFYEQGDRMIPLAPQPMRAPPPPPTELDTARRNRIIG